MAAGARRAGTADTANRRELGKADRAAVPRSRHGGWQPHPSRPDPIELLQEQASTRLPELVPIRYGRMLVSPFTFFRGAACVMAGISPGAPPALRRSCAATPTCPTSAHSPAPDRRLVFGVNDFDETLPGPFEWDVKRLVASFAVAGRDRGFDAGQRGGGQPRASAASYREAMREFAEMRTWTSGTRLDRTSRRSSGDGARRSAEAAQAFESNVAKARAKDSTAGLRQADTVVDGRAADRQRPAADRPGRGAAPPDRAAAARRRRPTASCAPTGAPCRRTGGPARALPLRRRRPQGGRGRQRRHARLDRADARPRRRRPAVPPARRRRRPRCWSRTSARASTPTTVSGWSRVSG